MMIHAAQKWHNLQVTLSATGDDPLPTSVARCIRPGIHTPALGGHSGTKLEGLEVV
jgi:hypothetical protein